MTVKTFEFFEEGGLSIGVIACPKDYAYMICPHFGRFIEVGFLYCA
jgi:hypothetical protein